MNTFTKKTQQQQQKKTTKKLKLNKKPSSEYFTFMIQWLMMVGSILVVLPKAFLHSTLLLALPACSSVFVPRPATTMIFTASMAVFFPWCSHTDVLEQLFPQHMPISILLLQWVFLGCSGTGMRISPSLLQPFSYYLVSASALPQKIIQTSKILLVF